MMHPTKRVWLKATIAGVVACSCTAQSTWGNTWGNDAQTVSSQTNAGTSGFTSARSNPWPTQSRQPNPWPATQQSNPWPKKQTSSGTSSWWSGTSKTSSPNSLAGTTSTSTWSTAPTDKIVGGDSVSSGSYPYFALYRHDAMSFCGGSLIHKDIVLTAAHCHFALRGLVGKDISIGGTSPERSDAKTHRIAQVRTHPDYQNTAGGMYNDFMLLKLETPSSVRTVPFNENSAIPRTGATVTAIGFGHTQANGSNSDVLREVRVQVVDSDTCNQNYGGNIQTKVHLCASARGKDSCQNDSGGPVIHNGVVVGVVSYGRGCAQENYPGIYARTSGAVDFIKNGVCELSSSPPSYCGAGGSSPTGGSPSTPWYCPTRTYGPIIGFFVDKYRNAFCCTQSRIFGAQNSC